MFLLTTIQCIQSPIDSKVGSLNFHFIFIHNNKFYTFLSEQEVAQTQVSVPTRGVRHFQKIFLDNKHKSTLQIPEYHNSTFDSRNAAFTGDEYIPHKWRL